MTLKHQAISYDDPSIALLTDQSQHQSESIPEDWMSDFPAEFLTTASSLEVLEAIELRYMLEQMLSGDISQSQFMEYIRS